jgi:hypothetical protein
MGYLHLIVEQQVLLKCGQRFKDNIIQLKAYGNKTEPEFCKLLGLTGDPYIEHLKYGLSK